MAVSEMVSAIVAPGRSLVVHAPPESVVRDAAKSEGKQKYFPEHVRTHGPGTQVQIEREDFGRLLALGYFVDVNAAPVLVSRGSDAAVGAQ